MWLLPELDELFSPAVADVRDMIYEDRVYYMHVFTTLVSSLRYIKQTPLIFLLIPSYAKPYAVGEAIEQLHTVLAHIAPSTQTPPYTFFFFLSVGLATTCTAGSGVERKA